MSFATLSFSSLRPKTEEKIKNYLNLSDKNQISIGLFVKGKTYVFGDPEKEKNFFYDIGSVTKTFTAHLILKLQNEGKLDIKQRVDRYLSLKKGNYPTLYQLLTHTAGYGHLTPFEITVPSLSRHGYARKNIYENCTAEKVISCLERRRFLPSSTRYGYSDFAYAVLAVVAETVTKTDFSSLLENFIKEDLNLKNTTVELNPKTRRPVAVRGGKILPFWVWNRNNPYLAGGGMVSNLHDMIHYLALQIESDLPYIKEAHTVCENSRLKRDNHLMCTGWHSYKRSNQLWHVGGVGTFRSSIIFNKKRRLGVVVLGNSKGKSSANVHYIAKMLYSELKKNKINLKEN